MPIVTDNYILSLTQDNRVLRVRCSQNDTSRQVNFTIYNNGTLFTIPSGLSVSVHGIKQNGNIFTKSCTYSGSVVTLVLGTQITNTVGISVAELVFTNSSGGKIGTSNFIFQVESDPLLRGTIDVTEETPTEYISDLVSMVEALSARVNNIIAPSGEASLSEVVDARLSGYSGTTYQNLKARIDADFAALGSTKADKSDTYTKDEVDAAIDNVTITTDETLSVPGAAADAKKTGDAISEINGSLENVRVDLGDINVLANGAIEKNIIETDILRKTTEDAFPSSVSVTNGYMRSGSDSNSGNLAGTSSEKSKTLWYVAPKDMDVYVDFVRGSSKQVCIFDGQPYGSAYRVTPVFASNVSDYPIPTKEKPVHVQAGQYITFSYYNGGSNISNMTFAIVEVTVAGSALKASLPLTDEMEGQVDEKIRNILNGGYYHLDADKFARGGWDNSTTANNRNYRVRYTEPLTFDKTTYGVLDKGYTIAGFEGGTFFDSRSVKTFSPNVEYKIYVRRFTEDTSETANINKFANALKLSTGIAPIELYSPTFADVSMFERVGICGDSYAAGGGIISGVKSLTWGKNLERQAGITVDIYAKSGQSVMQWNVDATNGLPALLNGAECGLYWLQHGINGTSTTEQFGTLEDITTYPHPNTFCGQYTEAIEQIKTAFPKARILMATIIGSSFNLYQSTYAHVNEAVRAIAEHCEVMFVDVADDDFYRSPYYSEWIRSNHPTAMQCAGIAMANRRLISKCIQENGNYFVNYGAE